MCAIHHLSNNFSFFEDNIFGEDEHITDMDPAADKAKVNEALEPDPEMDVRLYRPLKVSVSLIMHDIEAHLVTACRTGQTCPVIFVEQLAFEMDKSYSDTKLQVHLEFNLYLFLLVFN